MSPGRLPPERVLLTTTSQRGEGWAQKFRLRCSGFSATSLCSFPSLEVLQGPVHCCWRVSLLQRTGCIQLRAEGFLATSRTGGMRRGVASCQAGLIDVLFFIKEVPSKMTQSTINLGETSTPTGRKTVRKSARGESLHFSFSPLVRWGHCRSTSSRGHDLGVHPAPARFPPPLQPTLTGSQLVGPH